MAASYSTIPEAEPVERPKQKTSLKRLVASAALVSFALGAVAATLTYPKTRDGGVSALSSDDGSDWWSYESGKSPPANFNENVGCGDTYKCHCR